MKKTLIVVLLSTLFVLSAHTSASAESVNSEAQENVGLTEVAPQEVISGEITPYSMQKPSNVWNLSNRGRYDFAGVTDYNLLYTNYLFTGKKTVTIYVKNTSKTYDLNISLRQKKLFSDPVIWGVTAFPGGAGSVTLTLDSSAHYYLVAGPPSKFEGYIE